MSAGAVQMLRDLVHFACGAVPEEPRLHVKVLLAEHALDDAEAITELAGDDPPPPRAVLTLEEAYGRVKPALLAAAATIPLRHAQERHLVELPDPRTHAGATYAIADVHEGPCGEVHATMAAAIDRAHAAARESHAHPENPWPWHRARIADAAASLNEALELERELRELECAWGRH